MAGMRLYHFYAAIAADTTAAATLTVQRRGKIVSVNWNAVPTAFTSPGAHQAELSFNSGARSALTHDANGPISFVAVGGIVTTSGSTQALNHCHTHLAVPVDDGTRLYLHVEVTGTLTVLYNLTVAVMEN